MRIIQSLIGIIVGFLLIKYSIQLTEWFGKVEWAEQYLRAGLGGTYSMYRLVGLVFIIFSLLYMFNLYGFLLSPFVGVFGGVK